MTTTITLVLGRLRAALLTACVLPLSTNYSLAEAFGFERRMGRAWQEALSSGAVYPLDSRWVVVAILPDLPVMQMVLNLSHTAGHCLDHLGLLLLQLLGDQAVAERWEELPEVLTTLIFDGLTPGEEITTNE
jgi:hypothetical protein